MKEISSRVTTSDLYFCGGFALFAVDAEIVVEDEGRTIYLHSQWEDSSGCVFFEATTESIYDYYEKLEAANRKGQEEFADLSALIDRRREATNIRRVIADVDIYSRYAQQYRELLEMMQEFLDDREIETNLLVVEGFEDEDDEDDEDEECEEDDE